MAGLDAIVLGGPLMLCLAIAGFGLHAVNLVAYLRVRAADDAERRSKQRALVTSVLHLFVKVIFMLGALLIMSREPLVPDSPRDALLYYGWRGGTVLILVLLDLETLYLRESRRRSPELGRIRT